jgi:hypothetical protein
MATAHDSQPSPGAMLPSSHCSAKLLSTMPSPQRRGLQSVRHDAFGALELPPPRSQFSPGSMLLLPQQRGNELNVAQPGMLGVHSSTTQRPPAVALHRTRQSQLPMQKHWSAGRPHSPSIQVSSRVQDCSSSQGSPSLIGCP